MAFDGRARKLLSGPPEEAQDAQDGPNSAIRDKIGPQRGGTPRPSTTKVFERRR